MSALPDVICVGFMATPEVLAEVRQDFHRIQQLSPNDSYVFVYVTKSLADFKMSVSVHHG
jgi:hypothetical protein